MDFTQKIDTYIHSRFTLICVVSFEEEQILQQLKEACEKSRRILYVWEKIALSAIGLSSNQAQRVFAKAIVSNGMLDERGIDLITAEKKQIIRESGVWSSSPRPRRSATSGSWRFWRNGFDITRPSDQV